MRFNKFNLPLSVATGLLTATALATEPYVPSRVDTSIYDSFAQAETGSVPVVPNVPQEDAYQMRALPPQEAAQEAAPADEGGPTRYLETEFLTKRGINTYGWIDVGIGANGWGSPYNGPITFNDYNWMGQMNQLYLVNEKVLDTENGWDWGGRIDLLYGSDFAFTTARGLDGYWGGDPIGLGGPRWASSKFYGLAMPQLYGELGAGNHAVKFGHFYTIIGYEVVPAIGNFFYTHAYTMQYGEPFTHTGILDTWTANDQLTVYAGITNGWDNWDDGMTTFGPILNTGYPGYNSNAAFLGGATFKSSDELQALTAAVSSGNEVLNNGSGNGIVGNRSVYSLVYTNELTDKLNYVLQHDNGWQFNGAGDFDQCARWYGVNQYLFYELSETLIGGMRFEWFRDNDGTRVVSGLREALMGDSNYAGGFAGNFWQITWGLNWKPTNNWIVRPELRYDWYDGNANADGQLPFGKGYSQDGQFYGGCDAIFQF